MSADMEIPDFVRTVEESEFDKVQWGTQPKQGTLIDGDKVYNWREMLLGEAATPGLDASGFRRDFKYLIPELLNRQIITIKEDVLVGRNFVDIMQINGPTESFLKEYGFEASEVPEGTEVPVAKLRHEKLYLNVIKSGVRPRLTYELIADAQFGIMQRHIRQCAIAMAKFEDAHIMTVLNAGVPDGSAIEGTNESDHSFAATGNVLDWDLWVNAMMSIELENLNPTDAIMHPYNAAQVLKMPEFRDLTNSRFLILPERAEKMMATGQLPPILGIRLWVTRAQTPGEILMVDRNNYGVLAERQPLLVESDQDIVKQFKTVVFTQRFGAGILNNDGASKITGLNTSL
jgi:HK97 family phage major capsid protein